MNYQSRNKFGKLIFRIYRCLAPKPAERYQQFDTKKFLQNEMCPDFKWRKYVHKKNSYFKKWGFDISQLDAEYYSRVSGIKADHYVTRSMAVHYIYPYLDRYDFVPAYMDKNIQRRILGLPDSKLNVLMPEDVVINSNGSFFDGAGNELSESQAAAAIIGYGKDLILKPSVETFGGQGVCKVKKSSDEEEIRRLFCQYKTNFTFQKVVEQHPILAQCNPSSVNTIRVVTYRKPDRTLKMLYACLRIGGEGSVMDNVCSGGCYTGVNIDTGKLTDRKRYQYFIMDMKKLSDDLPDIIPCWQKIREAAFALHKRLPQLDIIGWDFTLTPNETPVLIEFNPRPGVGLQQAVGPMFSIEDLDELMQKISRIKVEFSPLGIISYPDKNGSYFPHLNFGGRG